MCEILRYSWIEPKRKKKQNLTQNQILIKEFGLGRSAMKVCILEVGLEEFDYYFSLVSFILFGFCVGGDIVL